MEHPPLSAPTVPLRPALFALPEDAARALVGFLDSDDVVNVASVNHFASRQSWFQGFRDALAVGLTLPQSAPDGLSLLQGIRCRNPQRIASLAWIEMHTPEQFDAIAKDPVVANSIESIRIRPIDPTDSRIIAQMCTSLSAFPNIHKLDVSSTPLKDVRGIAQLSQLQHLNLSSTDVTDVSALSSLSSLRVLIMKNTVVTAIDCLESLPQLQVLRVSQGQPKTFVNSRPRVFIPTLQRLHQLHTLDLRGCTLESTSDLAHVAPTLRELRLFDVKSRELGVDDVPVGSDKLVERLVRLEIIELFLQNLMDDSVTTMAKIPSLREIDHCIGCDAVASLAPLVHIEALKFSLPDGNDSNFRERPPTDFSVLLRLPQLQKLEIVQSVYIPQDWQGSHQLLTELLRRHATPLMEVLTQLPKLTSLSYRGSIPSESFLSKLTHLTHLSLRDYEDYIDSFNWIRSLTSLRSLALRFQSIPCDYSAISDVPNLEHLYLCDYATQPESAMPRQQFVQYCTNLKTLKIIGHLEDCEYLRGMTKLEKLTIESTSLPSDVSVFSSLKRLRAIDLVHATGGDLSSLASLQYLREAAISGDCRPLVAANGPPRLVRVLHPVHNCMARCRHRELLAERKLEKESGMYQSDDEGENARLFGEKEGTEDY